MQGKLVQNMKVIEISAPANYNSTAATAEWINMSRCDSVTFLIQTGAWAGGTAAVTLKQAASDGGSSAAVTFTTYYTIAGDTVTSATAASSTFNLSAANTLYVVPVTAEMLTRSSNYDWVKIAIASPGANNDYYSVVAIAHNLRYGTPTSVV